MTLSRFVKYQNSGVRYICMPERVNRHDICGPEILMYHLP